METKIEPLTIERIEDFFAYLKDHISDNGKNGAPLFLPIARTELGLSEELMKSFKEGQSVPINKLGWRRVLIAVNMQSDIIGHIDLKSYHQNYTNHRAVMGMGVHREHRKEGLGSLLIESLVHWAKSETKIEYIDLWVLVENTSAIRLYDKCGFQKIGEVEDMFRINGISHNHMMMTKRIT